MRNITPHNAKLVPAQAECMFKGKIYSVYQWQQKMYDGTFETFEMLKRPDTVKVIIIKDNKIVICHEHQPHAGEFHDIPGGRHDHPEEDELAAAKREVREETGLVCKNWKLLHARQPHGKIEQFIYIFLAWDVIEQVEPELDAGEKIEVELYKLADAKKILQDPSSRSIKMSLPDDVHSIEELLALPEYC